MGIQPKTYPYSSNPISREPAVPPPHHVDEGPLEVYNRPISGVDGRGNVTYGDCYCGRCRTREEKDLHARLQNLGVMLRMAFSQGLNAGD